MLDKINKIILILLIGLTLFFIAKSFDYKDKKRTIFIGECRFEIEITKTSEERIRGLGGREYLCDGCGMLFAFGKKGNYKFSMKNIKFPLDFIWIADDKVVAVSEKIPVDYSGEITSKTQVNKILEINSGEVERCKIEVGSRIK